MMTMAASFHPKRYSHYVVRTKAHARGFEYFGEQGKTLVRLGLFNDC